jgi:hypothetical protein
MIDVSQIPTDYVQVGVNLALTLAIAVFGYQWKKNDSAIAGLERHIATVENMAQNSRIENKDTLIAIAGLRTHISENYSPRLETQNSIARVHEKIEKLNDDVVRSIESLRSDIREDMRSALANQTRVLTLPPHS